MYSKGERIKDRKIFLIEMKIACCACIGCSVPVVLCLQELELILDAVTGVRGGELERLTGLRGRLRHMNMIHY